MGNAIRSCLLLAIAYTLSEGSAAQVVASPAPTNPSSIDIPGAFVEGLVVAAVAGDEQAVAEFLTSVASERFYVDLARESFQNHLANVTYGPLLADYPSRYPRIVAQRLRSSIDIAVAQALPTLIKLEFDGRSYASSVAALVVSTEIVNAVRAGGNRLLSAGSNTLPGPVRAALSKAGRVTRFGGASFKLVELVATEVLAAKIDTALYRHFEIADARAAMVAAFHTTTKDLATTHDPAAVIARYRASWVRYRDVLVRDIDATARDLDGCLAEATRKLYQNKTIDRAIEEPRELDERLQRALDKMSKKLRAETEAYTQRCLADFSQAMDAHRVEIYDRNQRKTGLFHEVEHVDWVARGARLLDQGDPGSDRGQEHRRIHARARFDDALARVSLNRLQTYTDQVTALELIGRAHHDLGVEIVSETESEIEREIVRIRLLQALDAALNGNPTDNS